MRFIRPALKLIICLFVLSIGLSFAASNNKASTNKKTSSSTKSSTTTASKSEYSSMTNKQVNDVKKIIHDYLISNPEVLVEAWQTLQTREQQKQQADASARIQKNIKQLFNDPSSPFAGNPKGTVKIIEFFDYQCSHCKVMGPILEKVIEKNNNVKVIFKDWPIFGGNSIVAAKAAFAANLQGKYLSYHNALLQAKPPLDMDKMNSIASNLGLNMDKFKQDINNPRWDKILKQNGILAGNLKLVGTPAFVLGDSQGKKIIFIPGGGNYKTFKGYIDEISAKK